MHRFLSSLKRLPVFALFLLLAALCLTACSEDKPKEKPKEERSSQERVLILKQRFEQLDSSLKDMEKDLEIQKKRIDSTRELVDSIRHSLMKGGLKGYSLDNVSTTDPLLLQAVAQEQADREARKERAEEKEKTDNRIFNGFLIVCFLLIIIAIFMLALKDRKNVEPLISEIMPPPFSPDPTSSDAAEAFDSDITPGIDDTGSFEYGELGPPRPKPPVDNDDDTPGSPNREQPL